jgi:PPOX class probable F420-dependent enzyme
MTSQSADPATQGRIRVPQHREVPFQLPDISTPKGKEFARRLREEFFVWLTTVDATGTPHSMPLGFLWDEAKSTFLIYSMPEADRDHMKHIRQNPKVGLHFELTGMEPCVLTGEVAVSTEDPPSDQVAAWAEKYQAFFAKMGMTLKQAAQVAPVALRIRPLTMTVSSWAMAE